MWPVDIRLRALAFSPHHSSFTNTSVHTAVRLRRDCSKVFKRYDASKHIPRVFCFLMYSEERLKVRWLYQMAGERRHFSYSSEGERARLQEAHPLGSHSAVEHLPMAISAVLFPYLCLYHEKSNFCQESSCRPDGGGGLHSSPGARQRSSYLPFRSLSLSLFLLLLMSLSLGGGERLDDCRDGAP